MIQPDPADEAGTPTTADAARVTTSVFHEGEQSVQRRAGAFEQAARLGPQMVQRTLDRKFAHFLASQPVIYVAASTPAAVWVSALFGTPGFAHAASPTTVRVRADLDPVDPFSAATQSGPVAVGMLVLEPMTRSRIRINGIARRTGYGLAIELTEAFGNCPKYIQRRHPIKLATEVSADARTPRRGSFLDCSERLLIATADTFIVGSRHPTRGADASHRGGRPGFVAVSDDGSGLTFPDYQGNNMFQTLGNLTADPAIGLLLVDWNSGRTLQLAGTAEVVWNQARVAIWPGAERLVDVRIADVVNRPDGLPLIWHLDETHRLNPKVPHRGSSFAPPDE
ncbi:MAG TPA: pyridoxamine 5'-phosphate oxidase family protein [Solirubrobacteraceae bacterium]|nr:pyridoxamine 5'-phosphate oxidase family protein [Solirubrobacteraceae bacterium]